MKMEFAVAKTFRKGRFLHLTSYTSRHISNNYPGARKLFQNTYALDAFPYPP